jgi:hypothetical protein
MPGSLQLYGAMFGSLDCRNVPRQCAIGVVENCLKETTLRLLKGFTMKPPKVDS